MGQSENRHEAKRWLDTANEDYETALYLLKGKKYSHSCFYCQQTGEKSLKALWFYMDLEPWGHSVTKLILDFPKMEMISFSEELTSAARSLDRYYIQTRYPDSFPDLTPGEIFQKEDAESALEKAKLLINYAKKVMDIL